MYPSKLAHILRFVSFSAHRSPRTRQPKRSAALGLIPLVAAMLVLANASSAIAAGEWVWWEGESAVSTNFPATTWLSPTNETERASLSGRSLLSTGDTRSAYFAEYTVNVPAAGTYRLYVRRLWSYGALKWRFDDGGWTKSGTSLYRLDQASYRQSFPLCWAFLGSVTLTPGEHTFRIEVSSADWPAGSADASSLDKAAYDAFILSADPFVPRGLLKPDQKLGLADPGSFAFESVADPYTPDAAVDLRSLNEPVAGQSGYVRRVGDKFALGDGTPVRFWGVTSSIWGADLDSIRQQARFLAKRGVNLVRFHSSIAASSPTDINAVRSATVDGAKKLVAAMKQEGIYTKLSVFFVLSLTVQSEWGLDGYTADKAQPFAILMVDPRLKEAYKQWLAQLLISPSAYSDQNLANDPAVAILELQNEDNFFFWTFKPSLWPAEQQQKLETAFGQFLVSRYGSIAAAQAAWGTLAPSTNWVRDFPDAGRMTILDVWFMTQAIYTTESAEHRRMADQIEFLTRTQRDFYTEIRNYVRNTLGYKGLIVASNWTTADERNLTDLERYTYTTNDVIDKHQYLNPAHVDPNPPSSTGYAVEVGDYYYSPTAVGKPRQLPLIYKQVDGMPGIISETSWNGPSRRKAEGPLLTAAYSSLQDIDGVIWFEMGDMSYDSGSDKFPLATPSLVGQFPATALLYRRGDVAEGAIAVREERTLASMYAKERALISESIKFDPNRNDPNDPVFDPGTGVGQVDTLAHLAGKVVANYNTSPEASYVNPSLASYVDNVGKVVRSLPPSPGQPSQLRLDWNAGVFTVNTPRAQGITGFLANAPSHTTDDAIVVCQNPFAAVLVVSLDGLPIRSSSRVLIQAMTDDVPYGWREIDQEFIYSYTTFQGKQILSKGTQPWNVQNIDAAVTLRGFAAGDPKVRVLDENLYDRQPGVAIGVGGDLKIALPADSLYTLVTRTVAAAETPTMTPPEGTFVGSQSVTLTSSTPDALIYYTTNGSIPTAANGTRYVRPILLTATTSLRAVAVKAGLADSPSAGGTFTLAVRGTGLPAGWESRDIGSPTPAGSTTVAGGVWELVAGGRDIWGSSDQFHFASTAANGDTTVVARVRDLPRTNAWAKAAVMIRETHAPNARFAMLCITPAAGVSFQYRFGPSQSAQAVIASGVTAPKWVRVTRSGNLFSGAYSNDGVNWTPVGKPVSVAMASTSLAGVALTSHAQGTANTSYFTDVRVSSQPVTPPDTNLPSGWVSDDIGGALPAGGGTEADGVWTVTGGGADIWGVADQFQFVHRPTSGDCAIVARVDSLQNSNPSAKAGVMIREGLDASSRYVSLTITPQGNIAFQRRTVTGGACGGRGVYGQAFPRFLRLTRTGNNFAADYSIDGVNWISLGSPVTLAMTPQTHAGLAVTSHVQGAPAAATFTQVKLTD